MKKGSGIMVAIESVTIKVPVGMSKYLATMDSEAEPTRNALLLYPYITKSNDNTWMCG